MNATIKELYSKGIQTIEEEGAAGTLFITHGDYFEVVEDHIYLVRTSGTELKTLEVTREKLTPYTLWLMTSLVSQISETQELQKRGF